MSYLFGTLAVFSAIFLPTSAYAQGFESSKGFSIETCYTTPDPTLRGEYWVSKPCEQG